MSVQALSESTSRSSSTESLASVDVGKASEQTGEALLKFDVRLAINIIINKLFTTNEFTGTAGRLSDNSDAHKN